LIELDSESGGLLGLIKIAYLFVSEFDVIIYRSIALEMFYKMSFGSNSIRVFVQPQI